MDQSVNSMDKLRQEEEERWQANADIARRLVHELRIVRITMVAIFIMKVAETLVLY